MAVSLVLQGYERKKPGTPQLERTLSFGMFHTQEEPKLEFNFGQAEAEVENLEEWVKAIKTLPPTLE